MELTFQKEPLLHSLQIVQGVANGHSPSSMLSNVLIKADEGKIECSATDMEVGIRTKVDGTILEEGAIAVPAKKLTDIVKVLPDSELRLTTPANNQVKLTCENSVDTSTFIPTFIIVGLPATEFPQLPVFEGEPLDIHLQTLREVIHKTAFAASTEEEKRKMLCGLYFNFLGDRTEVVATDGRQLALVRCDALTPPEGVTGFIVPLKAVQAIPQIFADADSVNVSFFQSSEPFNPTRCLSIADERTTLTARLIDDEYPDYEKIIPKPGAMQVRTVFKRETMLQAVRRISLLSELKKGCAICLEINEPEKNIRLSAKTPGLGRAHETVSVDSCTKNLRIGFDARLLMEALSHLDTESIQLKCSGELNPAVAEPVGESGQTYLIMPMKLKATPVTVKIIGVGGGGGKAVNRMREAGLTGLEFYAVDTDSGALDAYDDITPIQIGQKATKGVGARGNSEVGREAAEEDSVALETLVSDADMVIIVAGMGGGTGTVAAPRIASLARRYGVLTVAMVTLPFHAEGEQRAAQAENGVKALRTAADSLIVVGNQHLIDEGDAIAESSGTSVKRTQEVFRVSDELLIRGVQLITGNIVNAEHEVSVGFADVESVLRVPGRTAMGIGQAVGEERGRIAAESAVSSPLLEGANLAKASGLLVEVVAPQDFMMAELDSAMQVIQNAASDAQVIFGLSYNDELQTEELVRITLVATGLD